MPTFYNTSGSGCGARTIVVFSGGSAANSLVDVFHSVSAAKGGLLSYIIPISDNGGSSSELIRVFGGPGIGDVRSRLVRLIPDLPISTERTAIAALFNHRLSSLSSQDASREWQSLVDGTSSLWFQIPSSKRQLIRSFFNLLNLEILKRSRPPTSTFDFTSASVGNLFLTGARLFSDSFESAIYLLSGICGVPDDFVRVIPAINSNFTHHIAAGLADGTVIVGQNSISHPSEHIALERPRSASTAGSKTRRSRLSLGDPEAVLADDESVVTTDGVDSEHHCRTELELEPDEHQEDANLPGSLPTLRAAAIKFSKTPRSEPSHDLPSRIDRIWYINPYGQEITPPPNPRVCEAVRSAQAIIYSIGSLYTSIIPSIVLRGVGEAIRRSQYAEKRKILILNGSLDREVGPSTHPFTAVDFVEAIVKAGEESRGVSWVRPFMPTPSPSQPAHNSNSSVALASSDASSPSIYTNYVNFIVHLDGPGTPEVDVIRLRAMGIYCIKVQGLEVEVEEENLDVLEELRDQEQQAHNDKATAVAVTGAARKIEDGNGRERKETNNNVDTTSHKPPTSTASGATGTQSDLRSSPASTIEHRRNDSSNRSSQSQTHPRPTKQNSAQKQMRYDPRSLERALYSIMEVPYSPRVRTMVTPVE